MRTFLLLILSFLISPLALTAQNTDITPTTSAERAQSIELRQQMRSNSIFKEYPLRNIGPVVMGGRITDLAVEEEKTRKFYVAFASGGVFKTGNSGNTLEPIFDHQGTLTIGDIAISNADKDILWVGTGENNSSRSSYAGTGIYKSTNGGKSWEYVGLRGSQHIGRIVTHPTDPDIAWVASLGPLYSTNDVRGVYKTTDGGQTWKQTLTPADSTGVIDLAIHPDNPNKLWATTWERHRQAWNFDEAGEGSAIYLSEDGGESWKKSMTGFPKGKHVGRIGIDVSESNPNIMYAFLDNQKESKTKKEVEEGQLTQQDFVDMSKDNFLEIDNEKLNSFLRNNGFQKKYTAESVKEDVQNGEYTPKALANYLGGDANDALFNTSIEGAQVYRSENGGKSWELINSYDLDRLIFTYGYYFGEVRISPDNPDELYIMGVPMLKSQDGGKTWDPIAENQDVHVDHQALWIDPTDSEHLLLGNDGGLYESHDGGKNFIHHNNASVGQFYTVAVDMEKPYNVYGGLQDNGVFTGSSQGAPNDGNHWERIFGGDGMHVAVHPENSELVYTGFQFGNYFRINRSENNYNKITPRHEIGEAPYRFNWNTPVEMSNHNPDILYFGSQKINRTMDGGKSWTTISPDLTKDLPSGNVPYSTLTTISESPQDFSVIWAGTDDGNIQVTKDGGQSWELVSEDLPEQRWVSEVQASPHDPATAYASLNGYRFDEFKTYVYKTTDYGQSWQSIKGNLPEDVTNVIVQDQENPELLFAGLDHGTYTSFDDGNNWHLINGVPNVASYDMVVHPRDNELVVGTHGRSVYVMDLEPVRTVAKQSDKSVLALETDNVRYSNSWGSRSVAYRPINEPDVEWLYWIGDEDANNKTITITIEKEDGDMKKELTDKASYGFNTFNWNLLVKEAEKDDELNTYLKPGTYTITYEFNGSTDETTFKITSRNNGSNASQRMFSSPEEIEFEEH
ncbi:WD40/YVTN/BNR-like repeat-containing protein [Fodinibius saliphilus]|uniref:WD40/YVTN/BNR-like repeat-containing protein n=1 Tax=Fodinibius saliphilus TaxID=1920650 RepID=UPI001108A438|nr:glycosyl hydrolase [Fodinibius saliphilus]